MEVFEFSVEGSAPEPYCVRFMIDAGRCSASCTCAAGLMQQVCKHRLRFLYFDRPNIPLDDLPRAERLSHALVGTDLAHAAAELRAAEIETQAAKVRETTARRTLGRIMAQ